MDFENVQVGARGTWTSRAWREGVLIVGLARRTAQNERSTSLQGSVQEEPANRDVYLVGSSRRGIVW